MPSYSQSLWSTPPDFYQVIADNNLYRPLGWTPLKPKAVFELIATVVKWNGTHKALIRNTKNRKVHYAGVGDKLAPCVILSEIGHHSVGINEHGTSTVYRVEL